MSSWTNLQDRLYIGKYNTLIPFLTQLQLHQNIYKCQAGGRYAKIVIVVNWTLVISLVNIS